MLANAPHYRPLFRTLLRPLTIWGVDRRLFFLSLLLGAAAFNLFYSFIAGLLVAGLMYGFAVWSTKHDPQMLAIILRSGRHRVRYDAARPSNFSLRLE
jgi:type IV secretory pathway TrbD component